MTENLTFESRTNNAAWPAFNVLTAVKPETLISINSSSSSEKKKKKVNIT